MVLLTQRINNIVRPEVSNSASGFIFVIVSYCRAKEQRETKVAIQYNDLILSKVHPLYNKVKEGDVIL